MITAYVPRPSATKEEPEKMSVKRTKVICGFPGIGKSYLNDRRGVLDMESTPYSWIFDLETFEPPKRNHAFPGNYCNDIEIECKKDSYDYLFVSSHEAVRYELQYRGIPYIVVAPRRELKNEYLIRYLRRGSSMDFIEMMDKKWDEFIDSVARETQPVIWLEKGINLADVLGIK